MTDESLVHEVKEMNVLSFEQFSERVGENQVPRYNNFCFYFASDKGIGRQYRQNPYYVRFVEEHPQIAAELCDKIQSIGNRQPRTELLKPFDRLLYEAYSKMKAYGVSDQDLFR